MTTAGWKSILGGGCLLFFVLFLVEAEAGDEKWRHVGFTRYRDPLYLDMKRTTTIREGAFSVWTRITPAENSLFRGRLRQDLQKLGKSARDVKYLEMNKEIDCQGKRFRHVKLVYYDRRDRFLASTGDPRSPWKSIQAGSLWPDLQKAVCNR